MTLTRVLRLLSRLSSPIVLPAVLLMHATPGYAQDYDVTIDTSSLLNTVGNQASLDFQFAPGSIPGTSGASVEVSNPNNELSFGLDTGDVIDNFGNGTGATLFNDQAFNDIYLPITFGGSITFGFSFRR